MSRFAASQTRVNRACIRHLADASALLAGQPVQAIFSREYEAIDLGQGGVSSSFPAVKVLSSDVPVAPVGLALVIATGEGAGSWRVAEPMPDGAGMTVLRLERAA